MIEIHAGEPVGVVRPLHGVNLGPIDRNWARDYSEHFVAAGIPSIRVHDASLFIADVVDLHCIFPDPNADPDDPANYRFALTDAYLQSIVDTGAEIYLRIGESIEHEPVKVFTRTELWEPHQLAQVAVNFVRHCNEGWADGHEWGVKYVEFWNEPDNQWAEEPARRVCWSGTPAQYVEYYNVASSALKAHDPDLRVGLAGFTQRWARAWLDTAATDYSAFGGWAGVPAQCHQAGALIDFVSWHYYGGSWDEMTEMSLGVRHRLDELGLKDAESHLTEWHFVSQMEDEEGPYSLATVRLTNQYERIERALESTSNLDAAGFTFGALARLQDAELDVAHHYTGIAGNWGFFTYSGRPNKLLLAFQAFNEFATAADAIRVRVDVDSEQKDLLGAIAVRLADGRHLIGIGIRGGIGEQLELRLSGSDASISRVSARKLGADGWETGSALVDGSTLRVEAPGPGILLLEIS